MVAGRLATLRDGQRPSPIGEAVTQDAAAELLNVGKRSVERARQVLDSGTPEMIERVKAGDPLENDPGGIA